MFMGIKGRERGMKLFGNSGRGGYGYWLLRRYLLEGWILGGSRLLLIMVSLVVLSSVFSWCEVKRSEANWTCLVGTVRWDASGPHKAEVIVMFGRERGSRLGIWALKSNVLHCAGYNLEVGRPQACDWTPATPGGGKGIVGITRHQPRLRKVHPKIGAIESNDIRT